MILNKKLFRKAIQVFALSFIIISVIFSFIIHQQVKEKKNQYFLLASSRSNIISNTVNSAITKVYTINDMVISYNGETGFFNTVSSLIYDEVRRYTGIALRNILIAPNGVVSNVYPYDLNKALIGYSLMDKSKPGNKEAFESYIRGDMIVSHPFRLMQDNSLVISARLPIFLKNPQGEYDFWGLTSITLDINELLKVIGLESLDKMNIDYCLWYQEDPYIEQGTKKIILSQNADLMDDAVNCEFMIKNLKWNLSLRPKDGWIPVDYFATSLFITIAFSILIAMLYVSDLNMKDMNEKLKYLANRDPLTMCYSRNYLNTILIDSKTGNWRIPHHKYSMLVVDIDYFKFVNDKYGHETGDTAIQMVAEVLLRYIKPEDADCVIRFGGDEFIVLYNDVTEKRLISKMESILQGARDIKIPDHPDINITLSIGADHYNKDNPLNYYEQIKEADRKLYISKENGKNRYTI